MTSESTKERTVLITGGGSGIGKELARKFAASGDRIIINDVREEVGIQAAREVDGTYIHADLADMDSARKLATEALDLFGTIDILVNNAGFQHVAPVDEFPETLWAKMIQVMLVAPFQLTKHAIPGMKESGWGRIINMSSIHGLVASPYKSAYNSAKHGLIGFTKTVALEVGEFGITANAICPGYTRTPLVQAQVADQAKNNDLSEDEVISKIMLEPAAIKRLIEPTEVADLAVFLASDSARSITGSAYSIDLGWVAR
jgi:3-hydroxybutyrate dehydrogenase|tara:strand:+ start:456 stop:1229 length:774 start_codon:yes stop_codon:yes gene_type:complete